MEPRELELGVQGGLRAGDDRGGLVQRSPLGERRFCLVVRNIVAVALSGSAERGLFLVGVAELVDALG